jgi:hypothetical protein
VTKGIMKKKRKRTESKPLGEPETLLDRAIAVRAPANFAELAAKDPLDPEILRFLNDALAAANAEREPAPRRTRSSRKKATRRPPRRQGRS